jgi:thiosulfate/3-mercaptopyruvate sulfurtransferase
MRSKKDLAALFNSYQSKEIIFSCGSGITACILALGAECTGSKNLSVYDGSWTEWGSRHELPVEVD